MLKVNDKNTRMTLIINVTLVFLLLTLNIFHAFTPSASNVNFEQVNVTWDLVLINCVEIT